MSNEETSETKELEKIKQKKIEERLEKLEQENQQLKKEIQKIKPDSTKISRADTKASKGMSRRSFLKKAGLGTAGLAALGLAPASALNINTDELSVSTGSDTGSLTENLAVNTDGGVEILNGKLDMNSNNLLDVGSVIVGNTTEIGVDGRSDLGFQSIGNTFDETIISNVRFNDSTYGPGFIFAHSRSEDFNQNVAVNEDDVLGQILWIGDDGEDFEARAGIIETQVDDTVSEGIVPGRMVFKTTDSSGEDKTSFLINSSQHIKVPNGDLDLSNDLNFSDNFSIRRDDGDLVIEDDQINLIRQPKGAPTEFLQGVDTGPIEAPEDTFSQIINTPVTDGMDTGETVGHTFSVNNQTAVAIKAEADGNGGIQNLEYEFFNSDGEKVMEIDENGDVKAKGQFRGESL